MGLMAALSSYKRWTFQQKTVGKRKCNELSVYLVDVIAYPGYTAWTKTLYVLLVPISQLVSRRRGASGIL
jgi:hypothetical protein